MTQLVTKQKSMFEKLSLKETWNSSFLCNLPKQVLFEPICHFHWWLTRADHSHSKLFKNTQFEKDIHLFFQHFRKPAEKPKSSGRKIVYASFKVLLETSYFESTVPNWVVNRYQGKILAILHILINLWNSGIHGRFLSVFKPS